MQNPFQAIGDIKKMRDQAMAIQKKLQTIVLVIDKKGVQVKISGDQKIMEIHSNGKSDDDIKEAVNEAVKKSQEAAAKELQSMGGGLGGLFGR